jgi:hypothetical protein
MQEGLLLRKKALVAVNTKMLLHLNGNYNDDASHIGSTTSGTSFLTNQKFGNKAMTCTSTGYLGYGTGVPNFSDFVLPGDFTMEAYVSIGVLASEQMLFSGGAGSYIDFYTGSGYNGGQPGILVSMRPTNDHIGMLTVAHGWAVNTIHHLALTRLNGTLTIWLDGVAKQSIANSYSWIQGGGMVIGNYSNSPLYGWTGGIQEARISNFCRYTSTFTPSASPFILD